VLNAFRAAVPAIGRPASTVSLPGGGGVEGLGLSAYHADARATTTGAGTPSAWGAAASIRSPQAFAFNPTQYTALPPNPEK